MIDFWLAAGLLLLVALAFLLIPVLRGRRAQAEEDRTALNVALYQERLAELEDEQQAGVLSTEQLDAGRTDAARELLADTEGAEQERSSRLGKLTPLLAAVLVPLMGVGFYLHWGASDKVELAREFAQQPRTVEEMTARLEQAVKAQPDSAEAWYFLGRTYMAQERAADAASAFERAIGLAGRQPELLGQLAQALYFAKGKKWSAELQALTDEALKANPQEVTSLGLLGIAAFEDKRFKDAVGFWERLAVLLPAGDASRSAIEGGIERARERLAPGETLPEPAAVATVAALKVRVELAPALQGKVQPTDTVFVFARAASGPPMPLAVKRLTVADLPAEVSLSDSDAMMPQLKLSNFPQVLLVARVSRAGNAKAGEWIGRSQPLASSTADQQQLTIDTADGPAQ
ncbi:c-type cytochrome biogenesis protein CcmI [Pseudomonas sp. 2FE]|uniref:c-type cytochrome biogenesis protein CcmI n=1 Tax=Pseudomonas sp. 2FE TaxID=2502190 RepID=UPI0010F5E342|nr:c-type cytochrome biogenesis protein CcmI [Pseudomonas sp. 2FE]